MWMKIGLFTGEINYQPGCKFNLQIPLERTVFRKINAELEFLASK